MAQWAADRAMFNEESDRACEGDRDAFLHLRVWGEGAGEPTAAVALAWVLATEECEFYSGDEQAAFALNAKAAKMGYPVALSNTGMRLIEGLGTPPDPELGVGLTLMAIQGGYGKAAAFLAMKFADGTEVPQDLAFARQLLLKADSMDTDEALMTRAWGTYHRINND